MDHGDLCQSFLEKVPIVQTLAKAYQITQTVISINKTFFSCIPQEFYAIY